MTTPVQLLASLRRQAQTERYIHADDTAYFEQAKIGSEAIRLRVLIERAIARELVTHILSLGYGVRVHDGGDWAGGTRHTLSEVMDDLMSTDEDKLYVRMNQPDQDGTLYKSVGWFHLVYGNDGWDVIADQTNSELCDTCGEVAQELADALGELVTTGQ